jgi:O-succinylbenzoic acid--CoA ligase
MSDVIMKNWLLKRAELTPNRTAIIYKEKEVSFGQLQKKVEERAKQITTLGIRHGDHVAILVKNELETVILIHALQLLKAVLIPLNTRLTAKEISWQLHHVDASFVIYHHEFAKVLVEASVRKISIEECLRAHKSHHFKIHEEVNLAELNTIIFTSGTTGNPKGAMLTYGNHWWSATGSAFNLGLENNDSWLCCVPLFHVSGFSILMRSVIYGMTVILHEKFDATTFNNAIKSEKVTIASVVSAMLSKIIDNLGDERYPSYFRCMLLGGGPAPKPLLEACKNKDIPVFQTYGMTETASQIVTLGAEDMLRKLGSAGKPLFPAQLKIVADDSEASGIEGEILVKGPNVTSGYYKREDATEEAIIDGWLYTGDIGYVDEQGFLFVLDRRKDLIISGGENVYPAEIESALLSHPMIQEAGVTGIEDETWGQIPTAFIITKKPISESEIIDYCTEKLAKYKVPKRVYMVEKLPRNASNKILRRELLNLIN